MYINTFKYSPQDVSCQLCTEYVKKVGCTALRCGEFVVNACFAGNGVTLEECLQGILR